jgi:hypothetical protein
MVTGTKLSEGRYTRTRGLARIRVGVAVDATHRIVFSGAGTSTVTFAGMLNRGARSSRGARVGVRDAIAPTHRVVLAGTSDSSRRWSFGAGAESSESGHSSAGSSTGVGVGVAVDATHRLVLFGANTALAAVVAFALVFNAGIGTRSSTRVGVGVAVNSAHGVVFAGAHAGIGSFGTGAQFSESGDTSAGRSTGIRVGVAVDATHRVVLASAIASFVARALVVNLGAGSARNARVGVRGAVGSTHGIVLEGTGSREFIKAFGTAGQQTKL